MSAAQILVQSLLETTLKFEQLPAAYQEAVSNRLGDYDVPAHKFWSLRFRVEHHSMAEWLDLFRSWGWLKTLKSNDPAAVARYIRSFGEKDRFDAIRSSRSKRERAWPYISDWVASWEELKSSPDQHGDGFHRVLIAAERGARIFPVLFLL